MKIYQLLADNLLKNVPEFGPSYREFFEYYKEELPEMLMGEFTRFFIKNFKEKNESIIEKSLKAIENLLSQNNSQIEEIIAFSFFENLDQSGDEYSNIKKIITGKSKEILENIEKFWSAEAVVSQNTS